MARPVFALLLVACIATVAAAQVPSTDIYVLSVGTDGVRLERRVTDREGYDNQPRFLPDGRGVVYTSIDDDGADVFVYDIDRDERRRLTRTPQSEYSPTPVPGRRAISVVRDYGELKQQLWEFPLDGGEPSLVLPDVNPVGYHAWIDEQRLLLFVLGEPPTLQVAARGPGSGSVVAEHPGRALSTIPGGAEMGFVDKSGQRWWLAAFDPATGATRKLVETPEGREDVAWAPDGSAWIGDDSRLLRWRAGEPGWTEVADLDADGIHGLTRLAFSPDGARLAAVGARLPADLAAAYREPAARILGAALTDDEGWDKLTYLTTEIGHRLSGSSSLERAVDWAVARMRAEGLSARKQPVPVPQWVRGEESAQVVEPAPRELAMLGLGGSVGTPEQGITAPVVVVRDFEELEALGREAVEGRIVVYAVDWEGYGGTVRYRASGASRAAALGAVAVLVRSATGRSLGAPHTGALFYDDEQPRIPAAAISVEDADWFRRMAAAGHALTVRLRMAARTLPDATSHNVIAEIPGAERPEEVVVMGGHYDSWDVGEGAHDDGAGCVAAWQALRIIDRLGLRPRRTLRVVLWTNEENGLRGGQVYREALTDEETARHVAAIEMDGGAERPTGFGLGLHGVDPDAATRDPRYEAARDRLAQIVRLFEAIDAGEVHRGGGGADIGPLMRSGVPGLDLRTVGEHYFDWHHTVADTLDKVDPRDFRRAVAMLGVMGFVLADMPERLAR